MFIKGAEHPHETTHRDHKQNGHNQTHPAAFGTQIAFMGYPGSFSHRHTQTHTRRLTCARLYITLRSRSLSYYCISHILHYNKALPPSHPPPPVAIIKMPCAQTPECSLRGGTGSLGHWGIIPPARSVSTSIGTLCFWIHSDQVAEAGRGRFGYDSASGTSYNVHSL